MKIKKGNNVKILVGKDRGKTGKVEKVLRDKEKVIILGLNVSKFHQKARKGGEKGQIVEKSMPIHASNVMVIDSKQQKSVNKTKKEVSEDKPKKVSKKN